MVIQILKEIAVFLVNMLGIPSLLICYVIVKVKKSQDILQGVSKLDYLLKVSVFQQYKELNFKVAESSATQSVNPHASPSRWRSELINREFPESE